MYVGMYKGFSVAQLVKNSPARQETDCNARDQGLTPGLGRSPGEGNGNSLQYSCLRNPMDRVAWQAIAHGVLRVGYDLATKPQMEMQWNPQSCFQARPYLNTTATKIAEISQPTTVLKA